MLRVNRLAPDSLPRIQKIARAAMELMVTKSAPLEKHPAPNTQSDKRLSTELAEQLSRQTSDEWSNEAALNLYNAVKSLHQSSHELGSPAKVMAHLDSLVTKTDIGGDSALKKELLSETAFRSDVPGSPHSNKQLEAMMSRLFSLPPDVSRLVCEFVTSSESSSVASPDIASIVKGLVSDGVTGQKTQARQLLHASPPPHLTNNENAKAALLVRKQSGIKDSIEKHIPDLEALYKKHLKMHQELSGTILVTFQIEPNGNVAAARIKTSAISEKEFLLSLRDYLVEKIHFMPISEQFGIMEVEFPFEFTPEN
jgi:hypothetical protein